MTEPVEQSSITFLLTFGISMICLLVIGPRLPETHISEKSKDVVKLGLGLTVAVTSLVLGLITASVKNSFDASEVRVKAFSTELILLDRGLRVYGTEAEPARELLRRYTKQAIDETWPSDGSPPRIENPASEKLLENVEDKIRGLTPSDPLHRELRSTALDSFRSLSRQRWSIIQGTGTSVHPLMVEIITFWLMVIFGSFGLYAPRNATVIVSLFLSCLSIAGCLFLILDMDGAFGGLITVSDWAMKGALQHQLQ